LIPHDGKLITQ